MGCVPCKVCGKRCMEAETVEPDWRGRGKVIRIFSGCDAVGVEKDDMRTEFGTEAESVAEWNELNAGSEE